VQLVDVPKLVSTVEQSFGAPMKKKMLPTMAGPMRMSSWSMNSARNRAPNPAYSATG
jgi:hypothetical protein